MDYSRLDHRSSAPDDGYYLSRSAVPPGKNDAGDYMQSGSRSVSSLGSMAPLYHETKHVSHTTAKLGTWGSRKRPAPRQALWTPVWLRRWTIIAYVLLFTMLWASLLIVWRYSTNNDGLKLTLSTNHYAWTYGPTAILVIVVSLWRQVDYHCKTTQPWQEMKKNLSDAPRSMLLDYVSPLQVTSFYRSVKQGHLPVVASIIGFAVLKLVTLFSTGLLVSSPITVSDTFPITIITKFDASGFWPTVPTMYDTPPHYQISGSSGESSSYGNISTGPVYAYLRVINDQYSDPTGTKDNIAFQTYSIASEGTNLTSVDATVDAFVPNVTCEIADTKAFHAFENSRFSFVLDTPTCSVGNNNYSYINVDKCSYDCPPYSVSYSIQRVNCSESGNNETSGMMALDASTPYDLRWAIISLNSTNEDHSESNSSSQLWNPILQGVAAVICKIDYNIKKANTTQSTVDNTVSLAVEDPNAPGDHLPDLGGVQLSELVFSSLDEAYNLYGNGGSGSDVSRASAPLFGLMGDLYGNSESLDRFFDAKQLLNASSHVLAGISTQFIQQFVLPPAEESASALGKYVEDRLWVGLASLWVMVAGFIILTLLSLLILFTVEGEALPQNPGSIASHATLLASSPSVHSLLRNTGDMRASELRRKLAGSRFKTAPGPSFHIDAIHDRPSAAVTSEARRLAKRPWTPYPARYPIVGLTLSLPIVAIGVLEALYRVSQNEHGLVEVTDDSSLILYVIRYSSTLVVLLIATMFNSLDFDIATFAPFSALRAGNIPAARGILCHLLGETPLIALYHSVRYRHLGAALSNIAGLTGSVLTIIVSGLWVLDHTIKVQTDITASLTSAWDLRWPNSASDDSGAGTMVNNIQHGSADTPAGILGDLVFPDLADITMADQTTRLGTGSNGKSSHLNYTLNVPALRPYLSCDVVDAKSINISYGRSESSHPGTYINYVDVEVTVELPPGCLGGAGGNQSFTTFLGQLDNAGVNITGWSGSFLDLHMGPWNASNPYFSSYSDTSYSTEQPDNPNGCPSVGVVYGYLGTNATAMENVTALVCDQKVQEVQTRISYSGSPTDVILSTDRVLALDTEDRPKNLTNGTDGIYAFPYRVQTHFSNNFTLFNAGTDTTSLDVFFNHLVYGPKGYSLESLLGTKNSGSLIDAVNEMYKKYMVQAISLNFRKPVSAAASSSAATNPDSITGVVTGDVTRLRISSGSKLTLQIMLGVMTVLGALAFWFSELRGTLPRNPCSIASTMSLLAGSEMCDRNFIPPGSEWKNRQQLLTLFDGWLFSLGWWDNAKATPSPNGKRFGIDIGVPVIPGFWDKRK